MSWAKGIYEPIKDTTQEKSYLVQNQDVRGVGEPYAVPATFREASLPVDPTKVSGSVTTLSMAAIPSPIIGKYIQLPDGTLATPALSWASDTDSGLYKIATDRYGFSINGVLELEINSSGILLPNLTATRVVFSGAGGQLTDDAGLTYVAASDRLDISGGLRVGTATDTATAGDAVFGLTGASRLFFDQSEQQASIYDSSGNQDILLKCNGNSWYNGTGNFGIGTNAPATTLDVWGDFRITASSTSYANFNFGGDLTLEIVGGFGDTFYFLNQEAGDPALFMVKQTDNTDTDSDARLYMQVGGTSGGSPYITWEIPGGASWFAACDNGDSDKFKIGHGIFSAPDFSITTGGYSTFSPPAASSGTAHALQVTGAINTGGTNGLFRVLGAASTGQTASTEIKFVDIDLGATVTWATGALADQRCMFIEAPTLAFAGASTVTRAATLYIDRAPQAGTNATITNAYSLWVDAGAVRFDDWLNVGTATDASAAGDFAAGLTGGNRLAYSRASALLSSTGAAPFVRATTLDGTSDATLSLLKTGTREWRIQTSGSDLLIRDESGAVNAITMTAATGAVSVPSLTVTGLTSGRLPFVSTGGLIADDAGLTFSTSSDLITLTGTEPRYRATSSASTGSVGVSLFHAGVREYLLKSDTNAGNIFRIGHGTGDGTISTDWLRLNGSSTDIFFGSIQAVHVSGTAGTEMVYRFAPDTGVASFELFRSIDAIDNPVNFERFQIISDQIVSNSYTIRSHSGGTGSNRDITFHIGTTASAIIKASNQYWGFGTTGPDRRVDILDASNPQLRLTYTDGSVYADVWADSNSYLNLNAIGGRTLFYNTSGAAVAALGQWPGSTSYACFAASGIFGNTNDYALIQGSSGDTYLNAKSGQPITFRINNSSVGSWTSTVFNVAGELDLDGALNHDGSTVGFYGATPTAQSSAYSITNVTTDRAYDANATTLDEIADTLGTLIADLKLTGIIG